MITVSSIFRNSVEAIPRYFAQINALRNLVDVRLVIGEGDSTDHTPELLTAYGVDVIATTNHGGPAYGSVDHPQRWAQIAQVVRATIDEVGDPGDAYVWVESDLIWDPWQILKLILAQRPVAPMVYASDDPDRFYDIWGFRQDGHRFSPGRPYFPVPKPPGRYVQIDSCGSCFCVPGVEWQTVADWDGVWPFTANGRLWVDTETLVRHP